MSATPLQADARAQALATRRDELLGALQRKIPAARHLAHVDRELVVDDAITYTVMECGQALMDVSEGRR